MTTEHPMANIVSMCQYDGIATAILRRNITTLRIYICKKVPHSVSECPMYRNNVMISFKSQGFKTEAQYTNFNMSL